jgi:hypothetical protein
LGKSPGSSKNLKAADPHNRWGYFEHLPIRKLVWEAGGWKQYAPERDGFLPDEPLTFEERAPGSYRDRIRALAHQDFVQVYKDNALPLIFRLFPTESRYVIITRDVEEIYESPRKSGGTRYQCSLEELRASHDKYQKLVKVMAREVDSLVVEYESFMADFEKVLQSVCDHIQVELTDDRYAACRDIFRPRSTRHRPVRLATDHLIQKGKKALKRLLVR